MADIFSKEARSRIMRGAKSKDTRPELRLRKALWKKGLRYRTHYKLSGSPDIVFPSKRVAIFVHGCFWHFCAQHGHIPSTNRGFWRKKLERNKQRDKENVKELRKQGWHTLTIWEHDVNNSLQKAVKKIISRL